MTSTGTGRRRGRRVRFYPLPSRHADEGDYEDDREPAHVIDAVGLGLTISRDLARGMGGELRVRSTEGNGSTFTVTLERDRNGAGSVARLPESR